jgi:type II secretory pathway component PulF
MDADSRDAVVRTLTQRGLYPLDVNLVATRHAHPPVSAADLGIGLRILADLVQSGLAIGRALQLLEEMAPPRLATALPSIRQSVREGSSLGRALEDAPIRIPEVVLGVIRAGERGSGLADAIRQAATLCEESAATRAALRSALAYPALLATFGTAAVILLVGVVLPRFAAILSGLGQSLPATTKMVLRAGEIARLSAPAAFALLVVGVVAWTVWTATPDGRLRRDGMLLRLPLLGELRMASASASLCVALSALLESGVPIVPAMASGARATGNSELVRRIADARMDVEHGGRLSMALEHHRAATALVCRLARAGEESGRLAAMLDHAARLERERANRVLRSLVRLIEPLLIIVFGGLVALVAAALLQALYSVRPAA